MAKTLATCLVCLLPGCACGFAGSGMGPWLILLGSCATFRLLTVSTSEGD